MQIHKLKKDESRDEDGKPVYLTPAGIERLRSELARLRARLPSLAAETARTAEYGDRSDNAEYKQAKGMLRGTQRRALEIEAQLKRAVAIVAGPGANGTVQLGSTVVLEIIHDKNGGGASAPAGAGAEKTFEIVGPSETDPPRGRISHLSPLGAALIGKHVGDLIAMATPKGMQRYRILKIQ